MGVGVCLGCGYRWGAVCVGLCVCGGVFVGGCLHMCVGHDTGKKIMSCKKKILMGGKTREE